MTLVIYDSVIVECLSHILVLEYVSISMTIQVRVNRLRMRTSVYSFPRSFSVPFKLQVADLLIIPLFSIQLDLPGLILYHTSRPVVKVCQR